MPPDSGSATSEPPPELDELFRRAMAGGDTARLHEALAAWKREAPLSESPASEPSSPALPPSTIDVFERLVGLAERARSKAIAEPEVAAALLDDLVRAAAQARATLAAAVDRPEPVAVELPPFRHPLALVLDGPADDGLTPVLAEQLGVDGVTARMAAMSRTPRIALRGDDAEALRALAERASRATGLKASVVARSELAAITHPLLLVRRHGESWDATGTGGWMEGEAEADRQIAIDGVVLAVRGEVLVRRLREATVQRRGGSAWMPARRESELRASGEQRVGVIDLHGPDLFVRLVEGITQLEGLPGHEPSSSTRSFRALGEALTELWPGAVVLASKTCQPAGVQSRRAAGDDASQQRDGWPVWEEYTRMCRLHVGLYGG